MKKFKTSSAVTGYMTIYGSLYDISLYDLCMNGNFGTGNFELFHYSDFDMFSEKQCQSLKRRVISKILSTVF